MMNFEEFGEAMSSYRQSANDEGVRMRDPYLALERLRALYEKFDVSERAMADQVLAGWALSNDEGLRFDALALIDDLEIRTALDALRELSRRLRSSKAVSAPFEIKKVRRIIERLLSTKAEH